MFPYKKYVEINAFETITEEPTEYINASPYYTYMPSSFTISNSPQTTSENDIIVAVVCSTFSLCIIISFIICYKNYYRQINSKKNRSLVEDNFGTSYVQDNV